MNKKDRTVVIRLSTKYADKKTVNNMFENLILLTATFFAVHKEMADSEEIQPLVCDNGTGMVKVRYSVQILFFSCMLRQDSIQVYNVHHAGWFCWR